MHHVMYHTSHTKHVEVFIRCSPSSPLIILIDIHHHHHHHQCHHRQDPHHHHRQHGHRFSSSLSPYSSSGREVGFTPLSYFQERKYYTQFQVNQP
mmetsp:Transcript_17974/g.36278  ORF Transcript_17974/g.36278 Transcript_17974/m.36278 type:complete len:95 (-) Transcript_17974:331-615(-)